MPDLIAPGSWCKACKHPPARARTKMDQTGPSTSNRWPHDCTRIKSSEQLRLSCVHQPRLAFVQRLFIVRHTQQQTSVNGNQKDECNYILPVRGKKESTLELWAAERREIDFRNYLWLHKTLNNINNIVLDNRRQRNYTKILKLFFNMIKCDSEIMVRCYLLVSGLCCCSVELPSVTNCSNEVSYSWTPISSHQSKKGSWPQECVSTEPPKVQGGNYYHFAFPCN